MVKFSKGYNSVKNVGGDMVLFSAYHLMMLYVCTTFHELIFNPFRDVEQTRNVSFLQIKNKIYNDYNFENKPGHMDLLSNHPSWKSCSEIKS